MYITPSTTLRMTTVRLPEGRLIFDGTLETPGKCLEVGNCWLERILFMPVKSAATRVGIWTNDPTEPDEIWIEVRSLLEIVANQTI
jgi:hypothetical protein